MMQGETFEVRFRAGGRRRAGNPFDFNNKGSVTIEPDFVKLKGQRYRKLLSTLPEEQWVRMEDIVNVRTDGIEIEFDVQGPQKDVTVGFEVDDKAAANRIFELLPARQTQAFAIAEADHEVFHDRIDHWTPNTPVIWTLMAANILVFILMWFDAPRMPWANIDANHLVRWGSTATDKILLEGQWWRLATSMFVHGGLLHIVVNMFALWQIGRLVERMFGSARFLGLYLIAGVCGSLVSLLWNLPHEVNSVGASGAVFGIIGGLLVFIHRPNSGVPATIVKDLRGSIFGILVFNIALGLMYPHTDNAAHIGGLVGGCVAGLLLGRSLHVPANGA